MIYVNTVTEETMLWICEYCPIAAGTISRSDLVTTGGATRVFEIVENYKVYFNDDTEYALYLLRWA